MLAAIESPSSARASAVTSRKSTLSPLRLTDGLFDFIRRQCEIRIAFDVAREHLGAVDDHGGATRLHRAQHLFRAGDDKIASENETGFAGRDADCVNVPRRATDLHMAVDGAALLSQPGHIDDADAFALKMRGQP